MIYWSIYKKNNNCNKNSLGENIELDCLIVPEDVSSLADRSEIDCVMKIRSNVHVCFSYTLPDEAELINDTSANKKI